MLLKYIFSMASSLGKSYLQFLAMHGAIFPTYFAPWDDLTFIQHQSAQQTGIVSKFIKTLSSGSNTTPPIFSKIFVYNLYNNVYPKGIVPSYFISSLNLSNQLINAETEFYQASTVYDKILYFFPLNGFFTKIFNNFFILLPYREIYGLFHKFSFYLNWLLFKLGFIKNRIWKVSFNDFFFLYFNKRQLARNIHFFHNGKDERIIFFDLFMYTKSSKLYNYIAQFIVEIKNILVNAASSEVVKRATEVIMKGIDKFTSKHKSARQYMFFKLRKSPSLRNFWFSTKASNNLYNYFLSMINRNYHYNILKSAKNNTVNKEKLKKISQEKKKIHMPHLFLIGNNSELLSKKIVRILNSLLKIYPAYFDCYALKNSLRYLSTSPNASTANFLTILFSLLKKNKHLKHIFSDTREKKYRLDVLVFNDVLNLIRNRFLPRKITISDLLATTMFFENIYHGYTFSYIFTIEEMRNNEVDFAVFKSFKYIIYLENEYEKKSNLSKLKKIMAEIYNNNIIKNNTLTIKELTHWSWNLLNNQKTLRPVDLKILFEQISMILNQQNLELNYETLNALAKMLKYI